MGRFFADHPIPRDVATLVLFDGRLAPFYTNFLTLPNGAVLRAALSPRAEFPARAIAWWARSPPWKTKPSSIRLATAAVETTAEALGVDASNAKAFSLGCGMELAPDPERRLTLERRARRAGHAAAQSPHDDFGRRFRAFPPDPGGTGPAIAGGRNPA